MAKIKLAPLKKPEEAKSSSRPLPPFKLEFFRKKVEKTLDFFSDLLYNYN